MILIPRGFAHGFCTMTNESEVLYKVDNFYNKEAERGLLWNDTELQIVWPTQSPILSEKDKHNMTFKDFKNTMKHLVI
jgi:dTDP-4-dehydrorhamnose 3,5-epimerase